MPKKIILALFLLLFMAFCAEAAEKAIQLVIDGQTAAVEPGPVLSEGRVFVPVRFVAENLGAEVKWDGETRTVLVNNRGNSYLKSEIEDNPGAYIGIVNNIVTADNLKKILDDDKNGDIADYREGHNGGDKIDDDPLVVDIRTQDLYEKTHIPTAVWIAKAEDMAERENVQKLKTLLAEHVAKGGAKYIVLYDGDGSVAGLTAGVLGALGLPVKFMTYGFDIAWQGTKYCPSAVKGNMEDINGKTIKCGG